ncbi:unnamed protein product [Oncorhynchus mykiss]|uniref:Centrosome-associated FAM110 C-terminal domain-containing protein n=1 Tax=Oncorhynchus mykiss TaxID=8022 RepID=A0A060YYU9_ONCMY|nr:unnamed protein product [Oncorhynchus mykiss]
MKPLTPIGSPSPLRLLNKGPDYLRRQMEGGGQGRSISAVERLEADKAKYVKSQQVINTKQEPVLVPCTPPPPHRRPLTRMLRPDSLVIYRQKKECKSLPSGGVILGNSNMEIKGYNFKMVISEEKALSRDGDSRIDHTDNAADIWKRVPPPPPPRRRSGLQRSKSDLLLRCSVALSDQEHFFDYCGLDLDMVDRLGPENFLGGASDVDTLSLVLRSIGGGCGGSEPSEFSRHSGEAGLFQEEVAEKLTTGVSIIERNARVIKWLYSCKNAAQEGPKESTV